MSKAYANVHTFCLNKTWDVFIFNLWIVYVFGLLMGVHIKGLNTGISDFPHWPLLLCKQQVQAWRCLSVIETALRTHVFAHWHL